MNNMPPPSWHIINFLSVNGYAICMYAGVCVCIKLTVTIKALSRQN